VESLDGSVNFEMIEEPFGDAGVFCQNAVHLPEDAQGAQGNIFEISDGGGDEVKHSRICLGFCGLNGEGIIFHNKVGEQFFAGGFDFFGGLGFRFGFELHVDMFSDADVFDAGQMQIFHICRKDFALRVEQFLFGHDINFGEEFHV